VTIPAARNDSVTDRRRLGRDTVTSADERHRLVIFRLLARQDWDAPERFPDVDGALPRDRVAFLREVGGR
jgi:hypothetical protein